MMMTDPPHMKDAPAFAGASFHVIICQAGNVVSNKTGRNGVLNHTLNDKTFGGTG